MALFKHFDFLSLHKLILLLMYKLTSKCLYITDIESKVNKMKASNKI